MRRDQAHLPHDVYWLYDAEGRVLYVGCSMTLENRLEQHRSRKTWWSRVSRVEVESFADGTTALKAEGDAILAERPMFNEKIPTTRPPMPPIIRRNEPLHAVEEASA